MLEADFQANVVELAQITGWLIHHDRRQDLSIAGDAGFPDLVMAKNGRILFAELKSDKGKLSDAQQAWLSALAGEWPAGRFGHIGGKVEVYVWRPGDIDRIGKILSAR